MATILIKSKEEEQNLELERNIFKWYLKNYTTEDISSKTGKPKNLILSIIQRKLLEAENEKQNILGDRDVTNSYIAGLKLQAQDLWNSIDFETEKESVSCKAQLHKTLAAITKEIHDVTCRTKSDDLSSMIGEIQDSNQSVIDQLKNNKFEE